MNRNPILSVIIPTAGTRAHLLKRAVLSALKGWSVSEVEVLIVLNKRLNLVAELVIEYEAYLNVSILISEKAGVSAARNTGLINSSGILVRFLDDDDYLYDSAAKSQCLELLNSDNDFSSYALDLIDENGEHLGQRNPIDSNDACIGIAMYKRLQIPISFVFKRKSIQNCKWQEELNLAEDTVWLLQILVNKEMEWLRSRVVVGVWYQHSNSRLSRKYSTHKSVKYVVGKLDELASLSRNKSSERQQAIADGMWSCVMAGFKFNPIYWTRVALKVQRRVPNSCPDNILYKKLTGIGCSSILLSWIFLPFFWVLLLFRSFRF